MRYLLISDIHSNLEALQATIDHAKQYEPFQLMCLGDVVGYGADPQPCIDLVGDRANLMLAGNHDLAVAGIIDTDEFNAIAKRSVEWTREQLSAEDRDLLGNLPLLGVSILEPLEHDATIDMLARLGVIILLFEVGLESTVAQMMRVGLSSFAVATIGVVMPFALGWMVSAWLLPQASEYVHAFLGAALTAFGRDLGSRLQDVVLVTMTEFGRTARENGARGTDHGHASVALVLGGRVRGGRVHGRWPGLASSSLYEGRDLAVTTDFRDLVAELAARHLDVADLASVLPGHLASAERFPGVLQ